MPADFQIQRDMRDLRRYKLAWRIFFLLFLLLGGFKTYLNLKLPYDIRNYEAAETAPEKADMKMPQVIPALYAQSYRAGHGDRPTYTKTQVEQRINGGKPFVVSTIDPHVERAKWMDPASHQVWTLMFIDGIWTNWEGIDYVPRAMRPQPSVFYLAAEHLRNAWLYLGPALWFALLVLSLTTYSNTARQRLAANLLMAVALLSFLAWLVDPVYSTSFSAIFNHHNSFLGVLMILVSAPIAVESLRSPDPADLGLCRNCFYDLTGNQSGTCPECGAPAPAAATSQAT